MMTVHVNRLTLYHDLTLGVTAEINDLISHVGREAQVVEKFSKAAKIDNFWKMLTKWLRYEEPTWEDAQKPFEDVTQFLNQFVQNFKQLSFNGSSIDSYL